LKRIFPHYGNKHFGMFGRPFFQTLQTLGLERKIVPLPDAADASCADLNTEFL